PTLLVLAVGVVGGATLIQRSDRRLIDDQLPPSSALEWVREPENAAHVVAAYESGHRVPDVVRGILIDTFVFVPSYALFLAIACCWSARVLAPPWSTSGLILAWGAIVAGALDLIENAGILVEATRGWSFAAPITNLVCMGKWTLAGWSALFALGTLLSRPFV